MGAAGTPPGSRRAPRLEWRRPSAASRRLCCPHCRTMFWRCALIMAACGAGWRGVSVFSPTGGKTPAPAAATAAAPADAGHKISGSSPAVCLKWCRAACKRCVLTQGMLRVLRGSTRQGHQASAVDVHKAYCNYWLPILTAKVKTMSDTNAAACMQPAPPASSNPMRQFSKTVGHSNLVWRQSKQAGKQAGRQKVKQG